MRRTWILLGFITCVFAGGALIAPWVYWTAQGLSSHIEPLARVAAHPFPRYLSRTLLVLAVVGLLPLIKTLRVEWQELGLTRLDRDAVGRGVSLALATLSVFVIAALLFDARDVRPNATPTRITRTIITALLTAGVVSLLEEVLFRGALFGLMRNGRHWMHALILSSAMFALTHFLQTPRFSASIEWFSGFEVLASMLAPGAQPGSRVAQFVNLALLGAILALAYQRTGNLYFSIGLHAAWIFWLKLCNAVTMTKTGPGLWFWGTRKLIDGWGVTPLLVATLAMVPLLTRSRETREYVPEDSTTAARVG